MKLLILLAAFAASAFAADWPQWRGPSRDGIEKWTSGESFGKYVSLVGHGDKLLALDERGILFLLCASPEKYEKLGQMKVAVEDTWAHPAVCGGEIFIRDL